MTGKIMLRTGVMLIALVGVLTLDRSSTSGDGTNGMSIFGGLRPGMSDSGALATARQSDAGAMVGSLCRGNEGVGAHVKHLEMGWQLMAHVTDRNVDEVRLYRRSRLGTASRLDCTKVFRERVAAHYRSHYPGLNLIENSRVAKSGELALGMTARLSDGTWLHLTASRPARDRALCTLEVVHTQKRDVNS